jgi:hypothetical protein
VMYTSVSTRLAVICKGDLTQQVKSGFKKGFNLNVMYCLLLGSG